ncbi:unnamed protein product [Adineta ricciae]|uniref:Uncharacterized protein n=1 Tax=Adineta ricciae TaxID=249248 RepID=A0A814Q7R9_ADIRI|nr:unnamed protein product [Adineta ricciae]
MLISTIILLISFQNIYSLICIANNSLEIPRHERFSTIHSSTLQQLQNKTIYAHKKTNICHVTVYIDSNLTNGNVTIDFDEAINHAVNNSISFEIWFPLTKGNGSIISTIDFICSTHDLCDRLFVEKWLPWLVEIKYDVIQMNLIYLLTFGNHSGRCDVAGRSTTCSSGKCIAEYTGLRNSSILGAGCIDKMDLATVDLSMKMESMEFRSIQYKAIQYICTRDNCNDESTFRLVWKETGSLVDYFKPIVSWSRRQNRSRSSRRKSSKKKQHLANKHQSKRTYLLGFTSIILIVILVALIAVWHHRHHRNQPEYARTAVIA